MSPDVGLSLDAFPCCGTFFSRLLINLLRIERDCLIVSIFGNHDAVSRLVVRSNDAVCVGRRNRVFHQLILLLEQVHFWGRALLGRGLCVCFETLVLGILIRLFVTPMCFISNCGHCPAPPAIIGTKHLIGRASSEEP